MRGAFLRSLAGALALFGVVLIPLGGGGASAKETMTQADRRCSTATRTCAGPLPLRCLTKQATDETCREIVKAMRLCLGAAMEACREGAEIEAANRRPLTNRLFAGVDTDGRRVRYCFGADGVVDYETPTGHWRTGVWTRVGPWAVISMNQGYTIYLADLDAAGDALVGLAANQKGQGWRFTLPEEFNPPPDSPSARACRAVPNS